MARRRLKGPERVLGVNALSSTACATAVRLAARKRRGIHILVTITGPNAMLIDAEMPEAEAAAASMVEQAELLGGGRVSGHREDIRAGRAPRVRA